MNLVYRAPEPHHCYLRSAGAPPVGSVWLCSCGKGWVVKSNSWGGPDWKRVRFWDYPALLKIKKHKKEKGLQETAWRWKRRG